MVIAQSNDASAKGCALISATAQEARSLGTLAILRQIEWAKRDGYSHLYLGYWIDGHRKMDYKRRFRPLEHFDGRQWRRAG